MLGRRALIPLFENSLSSGLQLGFERRRPLRKTITAVAVLMLAFPLALPVPATGRSNPNKGATTDIAAAIDDIATQAIKAGGIASASIAVAKDGKIILARAYGESNIEDDIRATPETVYRVGSVTKQFTAAAVMQLVQEGKINLDDDISKYLPGFPMNGRKITVRNLLNHTSGLHNYTNIESASWFRRLDLTEAQMVDKFKDLPLDFPTGSAWSYTNSGFFLAGMIIEKVSGQSYPDYLRDHIFKPLNLEVSYCDERAIVKHRALGYSLVDGKLVNCLPISMTVPFSAGALCATASGIANWMVALTSGKVVSPESFKEMTTPSTLNDGTKVPYGFGLITTEMDGHRKIAHSGEIDGFRAQVAYYPDDNVVTAVCINTEDGNPNAIELERAVSRIVIGIPAAVIKDLPLASDELNRYTGTYELKGMLFGPPEYKVFTEDGKLKVLMFGQKSGLKYQGDNTFVSELDPEVRIVFDVHDGKATGFSIAEYDAVLKLKRKE